MSRAPFRFTGNFRFGKMVEVPAIRFRKLTDKLEFDGLSNSRSLRTSPQTGVAIPRIEVPLFVDRHRKSAGWSSLHDDGFPESRWRFPHQSADWFGMTRSDGPLNSNSRTAEKNRYAQNVVHFKPLRTGRTFSAAAFLPSRPCLAVP